MIAIKQSVELITPIDTKATMERLERAARTCYQSFGRIEEGSADKLIRRCLAMHHESVIEHESASFRIVTDRGVLAELTRHRLASYSVESTRYCCYKGGIAVIEPPGLTQDQRASWMRSCLVAEETYKEMIEWGAVPQIARAVLPTCLKVEMVATANLREWMHIIRLRTARAAHPQIREVVSMIRAILADRLPAIFEANLKEVD